MDERMSEAEHQNQLNTEQHIVELSESFLACIGGGVGEIAVG